VTLEQQGAQAAPATQGTAEGAKPAESWYGGLSKVLTQPTGGPRSDSLLESMAKSALRSAGSSMGRQLMRGLMGSLLGGGATRRR